MNCNKLRVNTAFPGAFPLENYVQAPLENLLFFDIETTGLSWKNSMVFLIGFLKKDSGGDGWLLEQWFLDDPSGEKEMLEKFSAVMEKETFLVHFNGQRFDLPYLKGRCQALDIPVGWEDCRQLDLYQVLRPFQKLLGLERMRLGDLEEYLGISRPEDVSGKECIAVYKKYVVEKNPSQKEQLLLHNQQDLTGLLGCMQALAYPALFRGEFRLGECRYGQDRDVLDCTLFLDAPLPQPFSLDCSPRPWIISGCRNQARVTFCLENGHLRMYYINYQDYYYLPEEDTAVHKSVGAYVDRNCRRQATAQTCYTRFLCSEEFLRYTAQVADYIRSCMKITFTS